MRSRMSIRSSSGPDSLFRYSWTRSGRQTHRRTPSPSNPHGHGLAAATSVNRAGNSTDPTARVIDDAAVLERLPQSLDGVATELGELVEEQDAVVREADLAGPHGRAPAAEQPDRRDRMMRRAERAGAEQPSRRTEQSGDGMELRRLQGLLA